MVFVGLAVTAVSIRQPGELVTDRANITLILVAVNRVCKSPGRQAGASRPGEEKGR